MARPGGYRERGCRTSGSCPRLVRGALPTPDSRVAPEQIHRRPHPGVACSSAASGARVAEIGSGSGVCSRPGLPSVPLSLCGIDIENGDRGAAAFPARPRGSVEFHDMWLPVVAGRSNRGNAALPMKAAATLAAATGLSAGDGRLPRSFLGAGRSPPRGRRNAFVGLERREIVAQHRLSFRVISARLYRTRGARPGYGGAARKEERSILATATCRVVVETSARWNRAPLIGGGLCSL